MLAKPQAIFIQNFILIRLYMVIWLDIMSLVSRKLKSTVFGIAIHQKGHHKALYFTLY